MDFLAGVIFMCASACPRPACPERLGLLLIGHGSPSAQWNERFLSFGRQVAERQEIREHFRAVKVVFMEFARPTIREGVVLLEEAGCQRIVAVPVFVSVGQHTLFDVPTALGILYWPQCLRDLADHGGEPARPQVPVIYTLTPDGGSLLCDFVLAQVRQLSARPKEEAVVILIHGDAGVRPMLERLLARIVAYTAAQTGIECFRWAYVGVGQGFHHHGLEAIEEAGTRKARILVVGLYMALSAQSIYERALKAEPGLGPILKRWELVFSKQTLLDYPGTLEWLVETAAKVALSLTGRQPQP